MWLLEESLKSYFPEGRGGFEGGCVIAAACTQTFPEGDSLRLEWMGWERALGTPWVLDPGQNLDDPPSAPVWPQLPGQSSEAWMARDVRGWPSGSAPQSGRGVPERGEPWRVPPTCPDRSRPPPRETGPAAASLAWVPGFKRPAAQPHGCGTDLFGSFAAD